MDKFNEICVTQLLLFTVLLLLLEFLLQRLVLRLLLPVLHNDVIEYVLFHDDDDD